VDNQLPASLVHFLVEHGFHAEHVLDLKMDEADVAPFGDMLLPIN
jgi:hypothetical protein